MYAGKKENERLLSRGRPASTMMSADRIYMDVQRASQSQSVSNRSEAQSRIVKIIKDDDTWSKLESLYKLGKS